MKEDAVLVQHGIVLQENGNWTGAESAYRRAIEAEPSNPGAHYHLGTLLQLKGERVDALHEYRESLEITTGATLDGWWNSLDEAKQAVLGKLNKDKAQYPKLI